MSETPGYDVGQVVNGHRWTGHEWVPIGADGPAPEPIRPPDLSAAPAGAPLPPPSGAPLGTESPLLGTPQFGGPAYGAPGAAPPAVNQFGTPVDAAQPLEPPYGAPVATTGGPSPFAAAAPLFLLGVLVAVGVSIAGIMVINGSGGGILWWGGYVVTFGLWRAAFSRYKAANALSRTGLGGLGTVVAAIGVVVAVGAAGAFALAWIADTSAPALTEAVGSCFSREGDKVFLVACDSADAQYTALSEVSNEADCPVSALGSIETDTPGRYLCLGLK